MRILFFTTGMTKGGAERVIATLANELVLQGHKVGIVCLKGDCSEYELHNDIYTKYANLNATLFGAFQSIRYLAKTFRDSNPDVVISFTHKPNLISCFMKRIGLLSARLVISERSDPFSRNRVLSLLSRYLFHQCDVLVCQSKIVADYYRQEFNLENVVVIGNPIGNECYSNKHVITDNPVLLSVGRLCKQKRQDIAIKAFSEISNEIPSLRLKICGVGDDLIELKELAQSLNVDNKVDFEGNVMNVMSVYPNTLAYLMTSDYEGFPNVLLEAMASGFPVVSTNFSPGVAKELVLEGVNGYIVPCDDPSEISNKIRCIYDGGLDEKRLQLSAVEVRQRYGISNVVKSWLAVCNKIESERNL